MNKVIYEGSIRDFVERYDGVDYKIWNSTEKEIAEVRKHIREHYLQEQKFMCAYCRMEKKEMHGMTWDVEHILPKSTYPAFLFEPLNLAVACKECNSPKDNQEILVSKLRPGNPLPIDRDAYAIVHPHFDKYSDHFEISIVGTRRSYRILNKGKASFTYIACNLMRFDYQYAEWSSFNAAIVEEVSGFLDNCPRDATPKEIKRMLGHLSFVANCDF